MRYTFISLFLFLILSLNGQKTSSELYVDLEKLASLKRVLYMAAHPDDENTRVLAWLSKGEKAQVAYFSLTRGDGGQNLIGDELGAELGILRSEELLAARRIDGAKQYFSRAVDFGYSKSAEESLRKWGKDAIMADAVKVIREFKPDIIITRFPPDKRAGHGHHTASAMLALEAIDLAANENYQPKHFEDLAVWDVASVYWNSSIWWDKKLDSTAKNNPDYLIYETGGYSPLIGKSYNEIGTEARSQHKCQGFGAIIERGERKEYFQYLKGERFKKDFFEKTQFSWNTLCNDSIENMLKTLSATFDFKDPQNNLKGLFAVYEQLSLIKDARIRKEKRVMCRELIKNCLGLYVELLAEDYSYSIGSAIALKLEVLNRSDQKVFIKSLKVNGEAIELSDIAANPNSLVTNTFKTVASSSIFNPYWLKGRYKDVYSIEDMTEIGNPMSTPSIIGKLEVVVGDATFTVPVVGRYKWRIPSFGEKRRDVIVTPDYAVELDKTSLISQVDESKKVKISIKAFKDSVNEKLRIVVPEGWNISPKELQVKINKKQGEQFVNISLSPTKMARTGELTLLRPNGQKVQLIHEISYDHVPIRSYFSDAVVRLVKLNAKIIPGRIGYIKGVEEKVPEAIKQLGYEVDVFAVDEIPSIDLTQYKTIVAGIRVYNIHPELMNHKEKLMKYIEGGGNYIVQYNTATSKVQKMQFGPYPFKISRKRVTEEEAKPTFVNNAHRILNSPNKITEADFSYWVQERGLYFAESWDANYTSVISWNDIGEDPLSGGLLIAKYGKGHFMYTGISFFRELPAGVEGAYRLFANLLSYE